MKKQSNTLFAKFSTAVLAGLTKQVKETIAFGAVETTHKIFSTSDLWNIHRQAKPRVQRRYF